ncbi:MAG: hypothetical protein JWP25_9211 [Bradyrhizobium sp.]|jgi:hypothetical protein|nr:hypothetical protein [Bradyrhizobium sp.]MEA2865421.1 hypothetical protein [Bradyrhizobium sp.]
MESRRPSVLDTHVRGYDANYAGAVRFLSRMPIPTCPASGRGKKLKPRKPGLHRIGAAVEFA